MAHVFTIDDDAKLRRLLRTGLEKHGHRVQEAGCGLEALEMMARSRPDVVLLDFELPDLSGAAVCRRIRAHQDIAGSRVMMLTGRTDEASRVECFEAGADDFVPKPFSFRELLLRIRALMEPPAPPTSRSSPLVLGRLAIDVEALRVRVDGSLIELSASEFALLCAICKQPHKVLSRDELLDAVWGTEVSVDQRSVDGLMRRLRTKLGGAASCIRTVRGTGYRYENAS
jgi:two-component system phosphate regulon response regulator PhoB